MTIPEILKELEPYTGKFPKAAMQAAVEQREAIIPELLRVVEAVADNPREYARRDNYQTHLFALFLLAQFREKRAYPAIVKMVSAPGEIPYELLGETTSDGLDRILASVYDGNPALLQGLVESDKADEFVRGSALDAFLVLAKTGQMPREDVVGYMRALFQERLPREASHIWGALVCAVADFPAPELLEEVRRAYADDLVDSSVADLKGIERDLADPERVPKASLITDAIAEMERWAAFQPEEPDSAEAGPEFPLSQSSIPATPLKPVVREPKIGRNEPCPCGSGKKYKRCCGK